MSLILSVFLLRFSLVDLISYLFHGASGYFVNTAEKVVNSEEKISIPTQ